MSLTCVFDVFFCGAGAHATTAINNATDTKIVNACMPPKIPLKKNVKFFFSYAEEKQNEGGKTK